MILKHLVLIFILFTSLWTAACSNETNTDIEFPPPMTGVILVDKHEYEMKPGGYRWTIKNESETHSTTTDAASPNQIAKELTAVAIKQGSLITIEVEDDPKMSAYLWNERERLKNVPLKDNQFSAPSKKGQYIYEVVANWSNNNSVGEISYTFVVEVK